MEFAGMDLGIINYLLLFVALYFLTQRLFHRLRNLPPSPFLNLPVIGHLYLLKKPLHVSLLRLSYKYGPVFFLQFGSRKVLVVSSPSAAEECLSKNDLVFANRPRLLIGKHLGYNYTSLAWAPYGDLWRNLRKISSLEVLSTHRLQMLSDIRLDEVRAVLRHLFHVSSENPDGEVDMRAVFFELTFNVMTRMIMGKRFYGESVANSKEALIFRQLAAESSRLGGVTNMGDFLPFMTRFSITQMEKDLLSLKSRRQAFMQQLIDEVRDLASDSSSSGKRTKTMIEILLNLRETEPEYYTDEKIISLVLVLLQGGTDTSVQTMEWGMTLLLNHPEVLKKARMEIDGRIGLDRLIEESDVADLPYLRCIINETLRMHPVVPLLVPHESSEACEVGGYRIPRGTMLLVNAWAVQNDPALWKDPGAFRPERFEEGTEVGTTKDEGFKFLPFGSGRRRCPGEGLAIRILGLALGSLIQCFDWEIMGVEAEDTNHQSGFTGAKSRPLIAKCHSRPCFFNLIPQI